MAFRTKKISQMDPKGANLAATDLLEISELVSGSYVTKSITGQEIIDSVPSAPQEVQSYANLAAFPVTGVVNTIYIAIDTNKTYRWTGSAYVEISATASTAWGGITGTLSAQTDLQSALNAKQDTLVSGTNIKTVNSTSLLGSGDVSVGVTSVTGTSPISSSGGATPAISIATANTSTTGALTSTDWNTFNNKQNTLSLTTTGSSGASTLVGATLNVPTYTLAGLGGITASFLSGGTGITYNSSTGVIASTITQYTDALARGAVSLTTTGSSGSSTYNSTTGVLNVPTYTLSGLGGVPTTRTLTINGTALDLSADRSWTIATGITIGTTPITSGTVGRVLFEGTGNVVSESANLFWDNTNGRLGIGGTPGAFTLDVNGTARATSYTLGNYIISQVSANNVTISNPSGPSGILTLYGGQTTQANIQINGSSGGNSNHIYFNVGSTTRAMFFGSTGNFAINTTTDAGYKLDVNGTARVKGTGTTSATTAFIVENSGATIKMIKANDDGAVYVGWDSTGDYNSFFSANGNFSLGRYGNGINYTKSTNGVRINNNAFQFVNGHAYWSTSYLEAGGRIGLNTVTINASAQLEMVSTTQGFLPPRMTNAQRTAIASPAVGLVVYQTDGSEGLYVNKSTGWALLL